MRARQRKSIRPVFGGIAPHWREAEGRPTRGPRPTAPPTSPLDLAADRVAMGDQGATASIGSGLEAFAASLISQLEAHLAEHPFLLGDAPGLEPDEVSDAAIAHSSGTRSYKGAVKSSSFAQFSYKIKAIILPGQARDKQQEKL